jgi:PAS domain S-box-containing protein
LNDPRGQVLIIEHDRIVPTSVADRLEQGGFTVTRISFKPEETLRRYKACRPDVVVLDLDLDLSATTDAVDLALAMRRVAPTAFVFVTARSDESTLERAMACGAFGYLVKPVAESQLLSAVITAAHRFKSEQKAISERVVAESKFNELFNSTPDAVVVVDAHGRILLANKEVERRFGYSDDAIKGEPVEMLVPGSAQFAVSEGGEWFAGDPHSRGAVKTIELSARHADGETVPVSVGLTPVGSGRNRRTIAIIRDVSERRLLEQTEKERRELALQFDRALRLETVGRLAGGIAHDFNNLLMVISGYTDALLNVGGDSGERRLLEGIRSTTNRAAELTRQLLAFGRRQVFQPEVVDAAAAIDSIRNMLARVIGEDIHVATACSAALRRVKVDPSQLEQVLLNLSLNARDAMPNGGTLTFEATNFRVTEPIPLPSSAVAVIPAADYVMVAVRDDGVGMERQIIARAFDPFFTTKPPGKGTGLGLSTVYGIIKQSKGFVWIESESGNGTTVYLLLPAAEDVGIAEVVHDRREELMSGSGTILLVEDEPEVRELLSSSLAESGYTVVDYANGRDALKGFEHLDGRIDLVLTDVVMPQGSGPALVRAARAIRPATKALYMSGYADDRMVSEIEGDANSAYLQKPFDRGTLLRKVSELLALRAAAPEHAHMKM